MTEEMNEDPEIERTARMLAAAAGLSWDRFQKYPGYYRTYWREEALYALGRMRLAPVEPPNIRRVA